MELNDWISLVISVIALLVSYLSHRATRKRYQLDLRKFEEERERRRFEISVIETVKDENYRFKPLSWWGVRLLIANRTDTPVFVNRLSASLVFRPEVPPLSLLIRSILMRSVKPELRLALDYDRPGSFAVSGPLELSPTAFDHIGLVFVANWETKQPIMCSPRYPHQGPKPGEKEIWILFGKLPVFLTRQFQEQEIFLSQIECTFHTDEDVIEVVGRYPRGHTLPDYLIAEFSSIAQNFAVVDENRTEQGI